MQTFVENLTNFDLAGQHDVWDVIIVGGGPAGLNAALVLGRCRRKVLLFDDGKPRNAVSHGVHGFLTRDGTAPSELRAIAHEQLNPYSTVKIVALRVVDAARTVSGFSVTASDGRTFYARKLLLAAGVVDELPTQPGFSALYGIGVFHCPYCDGWEVRDKPLAVYGRGDTKGGGLSLEMTLWSKDTVLCTDGPSGLSEEYRQQLRRNGVTVREEKILRLEIRSVIPYNASFDIVFEEGPPLARTAIFFNTGRHQSTDLAARLGDDKYDPKGCTVDNKQQMTHIPGLYVAGDASRDVLQVIVAAAEGAEAAIGINTALLKEDLT
jgi:thioredoxin reductase